MASILLPSNAINWGQPVNRSSPLNRGLVSWWLGNGPTVNSGSWKDIAGNNTGTLTNGAAWATVSGRQSGVSSVAFDGSNDYVALGSLSALVFPYQISFWQKPTTLSQNGIWISVGSPTDKIALGIYNTGNIILVGTIAAQFGLSGVSTYFTAGVWRHVSVTCTNSSTTLKMYIDGVEKTLSNMGDLYTAVSDNIGARNNGATYPFSGNIDDVRIHNRALSANEVYQVYVDSLTGYQRTLNRLTRTFAYSSGAAGAVYNPFTGGINPLQGFIAA